MSHSDITLVQGAIHNPDEPRHFMTVSPVSGTAVASVGGAEIARSAKAVVVREVGRGIYEPAVYFPRDDVDMSALAPTEHSTYCPLKGNTEYFDLATSSGVEAAHAAWSYVTMRLGDDLKDLIAFDTDQVDVTR